MSRFAAYAISRSPTLSLAASQSGAAQQIWLVTGQLDESERGLQQNALEACNALASLVNGEEDRHLRRLLLKTRRSIFNCRETAGAEAQELLTILPQESSAADLVNRWLLQRGEYGSLSRQLEILIEQALCELPILLSRLWQTHTFRTGVLFAQPQVYRDARCYFETLPAGDANTERRLMTTLLAYARRMATKTSPFSAFAHIRIENLELSREEQCHEEDLERDYFSLDPRVMDAFCRSVCGTQEIKADLGLLLNPTAYWKRDQLKFLRCRRGNSRTPESLVCLAEQPLLRFVCDVFQSTPCGLTARQLSGLVTEIISISNEESESFISTLIELDLLRYDLSCDLTTSSLMHFTARHPPDELGTDGEPLFHSLQEAVACAEQITGESTDGTLKELTRAREALSPILEVDSGMRALEAQDVLRHYRIASAVHSRSRTHETIAQDLHALSTLLPLFNAGLGYQDLAHATARAACVENGGSAELMECYWALCEQQGAPASEEVDPFRSISIKSTKAQKAGLLRRRLVRQIRDLLDGEPNGPVQLTSRFVDGWAKDAAEFSPVYFPASVSVGGQYTESGDFVVQTVLPGYGSMFASWAQSGEADGAGPWLRSGLADNLRRLRDDVDIIDLIGIFGFHGQVRPRITWPSLVYPGERNSWLQEEILAWSDTVVVANNDEETVDLRQKSTGGKLAPINLGTLSTFYLPPFYKFVLAFGPSYSPEFPVLDMLEDLHQGNAAIRHYPRLCLGRLIVLRETWCVSREVIPAREPSESDAGFLRRLMRWALRFNLPPKVFITPVRDVELLRTGSLPHDYRRAHKPFYMDWCDPFSILLFERCMKNKGATVTIQEAIPRPGHDDLTEYILEHYNH